MTDKEKEEIRQIAQQAEEFHKFTETEHLMEKSKNDAERFIALSCITTVNLLKESVTLSKLTRWLIRLTIVLGILTFLQVIILILNQTP